MSPHSKTSELRKLEAPELQREIEEQRTSAMKLRLGLQAGSEKDSSKHRYLKKEIARSLTVLNEKQKASPLKTSRKTSTVSPALSAAEKLKRKSLSPRPNSTKKERDPQSV